MSNNNRKRPEEEEILEKEYSTNRSSVYYREQAEKQAKKRKRLLDGISGGSVDKSESYLANGISKRDLRGNVRKKKLDRSAERKIKGKKLTVSEIENALEEEGYYDEK